MAVHPGSWFGLPDFGITEAIGSFLGAPQTSQGGSNLSSLVTGQASAPASSPMQSIPRQSIPSSSTPFGPNTPLLSSPRPTGSPAPSQSSNPSQPSGPSPFDAAAAAAEAQRQAEIAASDAAYQHQADLLLNQLGDIGNQKSVAMQGLENAFNQMSGKVSEQKASSQQMADNAIQQAANTAQNTQLANRNVLRALGILNSTYAADKLSAPTQAFDQQRAQILQTHVNNVNQLDSYYRDQLAAHQIAAQNLEGQYADLIGKIQADQRFNDAQKQQGILAAQSAFSQQLSNIASNFANTKAAVDAAKQNLVAQIASVQMGANPSANLSSILGTGMNVANQVYGPQTAALTLSDATKKQLYGLGG